MSFICGLLCTPTNPAPALMFFSLTGQRRWTSGGCKLPWCKCFSSSESCLALLYLLLLGAKQEKREKKQGLQSFAAEHVAPQGTNISERKLKIEGHMLHRHSFFQTSVKQPSRVNDQKPHHGFPEKSYLVTNIVEVNFP